MEVRWISDGEVRPLSTEDLAAQRDDDEGGGGLLWIDLDHSDAAGMDLLRDRFHFDQAALDECHVRSPVPKLLRYPDCTFTAINGVARGTDGVLHFQPLKVFSNPARLVTVLGPTHPALDRAAAHRELSTLAARLDDGTFRPTSSLELGMTIRKAMLNSQEDLVASAASRIGTLERQVMDCDPVKAENLLAELFAVRHDLQTIRTTAAQTRELLAITSSAIAAGPQAASLELEDLRHGFDHLSTTADLEREYLQEVLDLFQTRTANELNRFIRKITAWGAIGVAGTLIAGVYGMNFTHMPELDWRYGYPMALGMIGLVAVVLLVLFRRRGWL